MSTECLLKSGPIRRIDHIKRKFVPSSSLDVMFQLENEILIQAIVGIGRKMILSHASKLICALS